MRKFLIEYEQEITLDDVRQSWREFAEDDMTFAEYLRNCLDKNGALVEILTEDTPRENRREAVTLCRVQYSEEEWDYCEEWLTEEQAHEKSPWVCGITPLT